ncbi:unnamed protein product [Ilex paraguariensis]|uniref:mitogen-activated protein kinase kinase kinase n=1 Tax=Ilex paraguariensis TaxID=185542 RepID=A0ABC8UA16_9AQUA
MTGSIFSLHFRKTQMPSPKKSFSSSANSSSTSPESPLSESVKDSSFLKNGRGSKGLRGLNRKLTRQRKLRHVSDAELGLRVNHDRSQSLPVSPDSGVRSPRNVGHWSSWAVPQPLPLPELNRSSGLGFNLPSPTAGPCREERDGRDGTTDGISSSFATKSSCSHQINQKAADHVGTRSAKSPTYRRRGFPQDLNDGSGNHDFRLNVPARSAPTSSFSSPALSPKRFSTVDLFQSSFMVPQEFQVSQAASPARIIPSPDHSPLHSPTLLSPHRNNRSSTGVALHSYHKSLPESSTAWLEVNNASVHPLPLPPGVSRPSQSPNIRHNMDKSDVSSMKGQWKRGKLIGRGTFGSVYEATNCETGALCAMKEVDVIIDDTKSTECIKQLEQEIKLLQHLKHPNIVQYYGSEIIGDHFCIYIEYVHPGSINKYVQEHCGAVTESVVRNFTRHILSGLAYLHSRKTVHRDIKGANLLVDAAGVVKLADFGLAKHLNGYAIDLSLKGSPRWMAPEVLQAVMRKDANPELAFAIDIWSLGCTVIEMLTGKPPWSEFNEVQAMFNVLNRCPPIPESLSSEGKDFLQRCFRRNPADRPSAAVLLEHPFLKNSHDPNVSACTEEFLGIRLSDTPHSPRGWKKDLKPLSPGTWISETCTQSYPETSDSGAAPRHSPRSILEVLPCISSPELNCISHNVSTAIFFQQSTHRS